MGNIRGKKKNYAVVTFENRAEVDCAAVFKDDITVANAWVKVTENVAEKGDYAAGIANANIPGDKAAEAKLGTLSVSVGNLRHLTPYATEPYCKVTLEADNTHRGHGHDHAFHTASHR